MSNGSIRKSTSSELRLQQLRSFCATARLGSLTAAAQSLGLTQPTVGEHVHALEREFDEQLVETHGRGCRVTDAGVTLMELAGPLVTGIESLRDRFDEARKRRMSRIVVACSPRILAEEILDCLPGFEERHPDAQFSFTETVVEDVADAVKSGQVDLGLTAAAYVDRDDPWIEIEAGYELDVLLVTPRDHPLASQASVELRDLANYPIVNSKDSTGDPAINETLKKAGVFDGCPARVEASYTNAIRRFVRHGFGIGVVFGVAGNDEHSELHEHCISSLVGRSRVDFIWRKGALRPPLAIAFADWIKTFMNVQCNDN